MSAFCPQPSLTMDLCFDYCFGDFDFDEVSRMIPFLNTGPSAADAYLSPFLEHNLLDELSVVHDSGLEKLPFDFSISTCIDISAYKDNAYDYEFDEDDPLKYTNVLKYDCKWTGCDTDCKENHNWDDLSSEEWITKNILLNPNSVFPIVEKNEVQPYTPESDHCYHAPASKQVRIKKETSENVDSMDILSIPTPPSSYSSETSSEDEVDVVTVPEEYLPPVVTRNFEVPRRNTRSQRILKKPQMSTIFSARTLKAALKNSKKKNSSVGRPHGRRKGKHSIIELTPSNSNSNISSAQSSRCSSDVEESGKRQNHNCSERKRREVQRTALQNLRGCIPNLQNNEKAPKVLILSSATDLIKTLKLNQRTLDELKYRELKRRNELSAKLNQLRMRLKI